jgi:hypothetical protein
VREFVSRKLTGVMKVKSAFRSVRYDPFFRKRRSIVPSMQFDCLVEIERTCWDPKDGELCLSRTKPEETLVEVRSGSDVQIDRQT